jgi:glutathione S-transferase
MAEAAQPRLKLYHAAPSRSSTARWMLEEVGEPYEIALLNLKAGDQQQASYRVLNPMGKVPTLVADGVPISEVAAICCYLADAYPEANLAPPIGDQRRGTYLKWLFFGPSCIEPAMIDKALNRAAAPRTTAGWADYDTVITMLREALADTPYLLGEQFTAADVVIGATIRWGLLFKLLPDPPEFTAYVERLSVRPAMQRQIAADQELMQAQKNA